jgi:hypothetical protein
MEVSKPKYIWSPERLAVLKEMAAQNRTYKQIGVVFGVSDSTVKRGLRRLGIQTRRALAYSKVRMFGPESPENVERWSKSCPLSTEPERGTRQP